MIGNYYDLTIKQFLKIRSITELESDPFMRNLKMVAEIENKTVDEIESMPVGDVIEKVKRLASIESLEPNAKVKMKIKIGGKRFKIKWKQQELTAEQYIDSCHFSKDKDQIINNIHNILAAISVELDWMGREKPYNGTTHKERADLFYNQMKISQAYPIMLFFCKYYQELTEATLSYLESEAMKAVKMVREKYLSSTQNGDGLQSLTT
jgi:hypothetical protein